MHQMNRTRLSFFTPFAIMMYMSHDGVVSILFADWP